MTRLYVCFAFVVMTFYDQKLDNMQNLHNHVQTVIVLQVIVH